MIDARSTAGETAAAIAAGKVSAAEATEAALARIQAGNPRINAVTRVFRERALATATAIDARRARGEALGPLAGVPYAVAGDNAAELGEHAVRLLTEGASLDEVQAMILGSDEYYLLSGGTDAGFLAAVYDAVLHRAVDASGASGWGQLLTQGGSREQVALAILGSAESDQVTLGDGYHALLGRDADAMGLSAWGTALQNGLSDEDFAALLIASDEYFARIR